MENGLFTKARFRIAGDRGLLVEYGDAIHPAVNQKVRAMAAVLAADPPDGVVEIIPTYRSILVYYDPAATAPQVLEPVLTNLENRLSEVEIPPPRVVVIPVCYGGAYGPDIGFVAESHAMDIDDVIRIHSQPEYLIYMVGFTPGFPFLGGLPESLHTPRLETPRTRVPEGSVGIANNQTGVYPIASPGGWQLIGRTPLKLFAPERHPPIRYQAGDRIRFTPVSPEAFEQLAAKEAES